MKFSPNPLFLFFLGLVFLASAGAPAPLPADSLEESNGAVFTDPTEKSFKVRGYGFLGNLRLTRTLQLIESDYGEEEWYSADFIEDGVLILLNRMLQDGHLRPTARVRFIHAEDGQEEELEWDHRFRTQAPRPLEAAEIRFQLNPGVLYFYDEISFSGLEDNLGRQLFDEGELRGYFYPSGFLINLRSSRIFTPRGFEQGKENIREAMARKGYRNAAVEGTIVEQDDESGRVRVEVNLQSGKRHIVRTLREEIFPTGYDEPSSIEIDHPEVPWSRIWVQDTNVRLRNMFFHQGYPDTRSEITIESEEESDGEIFIDAVAKVRKGDFAEVGDIHFEGDDRTSRGILRRRLLIRSGEPLDRMAVERSRQRLAAIGAFDRVTVDIEDTGEEQRDVTFTFEETGRLDISALIGYGSYEYLRGGLEIDQRNLFRRGHQARTRLIQSFKSTEADYRYTIPELFGEEVTGFGRASFLNREEIDFDRREWGLSFGMRRYFSRIDADVTLRYAFEFLESRRLAELQEVASSQSRVGSISLEIRRDRRNNPINPERGYFLFSNKELSAEYLAGDSEFFRWEWGGSYHRPLGNFGLTYHTGFNHGFVIAFGDEKEVLPFNKRFFLGGDSSQRGYRFGEASPKSEDNNIIGAETYFFLGNELEQALTQNLSAVVFVDSLLIGAELSDYPGEDLLISGGLGLRYQTVVGPARLEYAQNIKKRDVDPSGRIHLTLGFPF